ncbi:tetratricopeptide repeat-containing sulfotransferase family protein [Thalassotalea montiporae]
MITVNTIRKAEQAHQQGQLAEAESLYRQALSNEQHIDAIYGLATLKMQLKEYAVATQLFEQALSIEPQALDINFNYLLCLKQSNQVEQAKGRLREISHLVGNNSQMVSAFANLAFELGDYQQVINITSVSQLNQDNINFIAAKAHMALNQWPDAIQYLVKLSERHPTNTEHLNLLAQCFGHTLNFNLAMPIFEQLTALAPSLENTLRYADLCILAQHKAKAEQLVAQLETHANTEFSTQASLQLLSIKTKLARLNHDKAQAISLAEQLLAREPSSSLAWQVLFELGNDSAHKQVLKQLPAVVETSEQHSFDYRQNLYTLAKVYEKSDEYQRAFEYFTRANQSQYFQLANQNRAFSYQTLKAEINKLTEIDYAHLAETEQSKTPATNSATDHPTNIFVVGMPRSGTTLVNRILCQATNVASVNESNGIASVYEHLLAQIAAADIPAYLAKNAKALAEKYRDALPALPAHTEIIVDKMPHNFRFVGAILASFPRAKIIQMRRNPEDLALSIFSQQFNDYHNYACDQKAIAQTIFEANKLMDVWAKRYPEQVYDLSYEDLVNNPESEAKAIFEFLSLHWQPSYLEFYQQAVPSFTFSEVQVRKPINQSKIGFAKHYHDQLSEFRATYNKLLK